VRRHVLNRDEAGRERLQECLRLSGFVPRIILTQTTPIPSLPGQNFDIPEPHPRLGSLKPKGESHPLFLIKKIVWANPGLSAFRARTGPISRLMRPSIGVVLMDTEGLTSLPT